MESTQEKIQHVLEQIFEKEKIKTHYKESIANLKKANLRLIDLHNKLEKEFNDVQQIENLSMKSLFHKVLGSKEEQIEIERQEYLQATLQYKEFKKQVELLEFECNILEKKLENTNRLEQELELLQKIREQEILSSNAPKASELRFIVSTLDHLTKRKKALFTAYESGNIVMKYINSMRDSLFKAKDWGRWDMMTSDRAASLYKHDAIDNAKNNAHYIRHHLEVFRRDLIKVGKSDIHFNFNMGNFNRFSDIFFDNLISDWVIQQKIKNALHSVMELHDRLERIINSLELKHKYARDEIIDLMKKRKAILLEK